MLSQSLIPKTHVQFAQYEICKQCMHVYFIYKIIKLGFYIPHIFLVYKAVLASWVNPLTLCAMLVQWLVMLVLAQTQKPFNFTIPFPF